MDIKRIVYIFDAVHNCNENICDRIFTNLTRDFNNLFNIIIPFVGNTANVRCLVMNSLDEVFLTKDAMNFVMISYLNAISDHIFV